MLKLVRFLKDYKIQVFFGPIFKLIEAIFELITPLLMARVIDVGVSSGDWHYVLRMGGLMVLIGAAGLAFALTCQFLASQASQGFGTAVRNALYRKVNSFSHAQIDQFGTPTLITRILNDVNQLQLAVAMLIRLAIRAPFLAIGAMVMAMILDLKLSVVFFVVTPLVALTLYIIMTKSVPFYKQIQRGVDKVSLITRENLSGARVIRAFSDQAGQEERFGQTNQALCDQMVRVGRLSALLNPLTSVILNLGVVAVLWFGGHRVNVGGLTTGEIIAFINYISQTLLAVIVLANLVVIFTRASASAARVNEVFETEPSVQSPSVGAQPRDTDCMVEFRNVSFSYNQGGEHALRNVSFQARRGDRIGIIGGTGSGKSTLVNLIPRFYDVTEGEVLVSGVNVKDYTLSQLRDKIGVVPQRTVLFSGTIAQNLRWGKADATDADLRWAASVAQAAEFVERMPQQYDSFITQGGKNVSGGQKQRLTIARALVGRPEILVLDDSSSALDFATDAALRAALLKEAGDTTVFMVSQRAGTIRHADLIIVLDDGQVAGIGKHADLYASCPVYREICDSQLQHGEVEA